MDTNCSKIDFMVCLVIKSSNISINELESLVKSTLIPFANDNEWGVEPPLVIVENYNKNLANLELEEF